MGLEVNAGKTKHMFMSHEQNAGKKHNLKLGNKYFESVRKFGYVETILTNQNGIYE
jgi:hypothetical protein